MSWHRNIGGLVTTALISLGFAVSAALAWEYLGDSGGMCTVGGGCDTVRSSPYASLLGIPVPVVGLIYFGLLAVLLAARRLRALRALSAVGALAGAGFLALQGLVIGAFCPWCVVVDLAAIALSLSTRYTHPHEHSAWFRPLALSGPPLAAISLLVFPSRPTPPTAPPSPGIATAASSLTVVEFIDFQCPFCRALHQRLSNLLRDFPQIELQRRHLPLPQHEHAAIAARAACCAEEAGQGDAMADKLFAAARPDASTCREIARELKLDLPTFDACLTSPRVDHRLTADLELARTLNVRALPTLLIGDERLEGLPDEATLRASLVLAMASAAAQR